jgi:non-canonical (house-cleaning) NTP pyrophosphatase
MKIISGTESSLKLAVITEFLKSNYNFKVDLICTNADSGVPETPYADDTYKGAINRAQFCFDKFKDPSAMYIGIESGLERKLESYFEFCVCCIFFKGSYYYGISSEMMLPLSISTRLEDNETHEHIMQELDKQSSLNIKDTWHHYSQGQIKREVSLFEAIRNAFYAIPDL